MIRFILNDTEQHTDMPPGMLLLDYVRYHKNLTGTKIGCREGDCGACTVLIGELKNEETIYRSFTSCLTPIGNVHGKHVVTIEGLNMADLNPVQKAMSDCSATQCGFCTPGFVISLAGFCLSKKEPTYENAITAIDGNICRCTGYKSIERAAAQVADLMSGKKDSDPLQFVADNKMLPAYFAGITMRLKQLSLKLNGALINKAKNPVYVGGGTDLYVQKQEEMKYAGIQFMSAEGTHSIRTEGKRIVFDQSVTVTDLIESSLIQRSFPAFNKFAQLVSSTPIRNMATIAGNFINASPIGDFTIFFLAINATVILSDGKKSRELPLHKLYKQYKVLDRKTKEYITQIFFEPPAANTFVNFEKVSKRTHLDIASVNTAVCITIDGRAIKEARISAGGVGPIPKLLEKTNSFLQGKMLDEGLITEAIAIAQSEISPISDTRGAAVYKSFLLGQLIKAHFIELFPQMIGANLAVARR
ncbi:MAG: FAD binding domain-containing protein [Bacteroidota bacterium]